MSSGQRGVVKLEGEPLPSVNIFMQVPLLVFIVIYRQHDKHRNRSSHYDNE